MPKDGTALSKDAAPGSAGPQVGRAGPWVIYRGRRGVFRFAHASKLRGPFIATATDQEAARRICRELARDERSRSGPFRPTKEWRDPTDDRRRKNRLETSPTKPYPCGHPRTAENSYGEPGQTTCRQCKIRRSRARYKAAPKVRARQLRHEQRAAEARPDLDRLAFLMYRQLRSLMTREGAWPLKPRSKEGRGRA